MPFWLPATTPIMLREHVPVLILRQPGLIICKSPDNKFLLLLPSKKSAEEMTDPAKEAALLFHLGYN